MATTKEKFLKKLEQQLPELCSTTDLAAIKIFGNKATIAKDRRYKRGIPFLSLSKCRTKYLRDDVLTYASERFNELRQ